MLSSKRNWADFVWWLKVDEAALENSRQEMIVLQRSIYQRDEELKLYRELLRDKNQPDGLSVAEFRLSSLDDGRIEYRWVARQKTSEDEDPAGTCRIVAIR